MEFILEQPKPKSDSIWDNYVPIVTQGNTYTVYLTDSIDGPAEYNQLIYLLSNLDHYHTVNIYINNGGGIIDSAFMIIDAIKRSEATITAVLSGTVASAATVIALACDNIEVAPYTSWLSHNYSSGLSGKGHEMRAQQEFTDKELNAAFREIHKGFFSEDEVTDLIDGKDIWLGKDEIIARWEARGS